MRNSHVETNYRCTERRMLWAAVEALQEQGLTAKQADILHNTAPRRLMAKMDWTGYNGVQVKQQKAFVTLVRFAGCAQYQQFLFSLFVVDIRERKERSSLLAHRQDHF